MPERPDLEYQVGLMQSLVGAALTGARVHDPVLVRQLVPGDPRALLRGQSIRSVSRHLHFVRFELDELWVIIHPMLAGRFTLCAPAAKLTRDTGFVLELGGFALGAAELRYRDEKQMGKIYLAPASSLDQIPGYAHAGIDVLGPDFSLEALRRLARGHREQVKVWLMDKTCFDAFGNAYADEAMFAAGLHPKLRVNELTAEDLGRLHQGMIEVLRGAREELALRRPALDEKVRDFLWVRNRLGQPCPRCGAPVRVVGVHGHDAFFCAVCQPDRAGRGPVDWGRVAR